MTWGELVTKAQKITGDVDADVLVQLKQDMNIGNRRFNAALNNYFNRRSKSTSIEEDQQYYQLPVDAVRVTGVDFLESTTRRVPLDQIRSEYGWRQLNRSNNSGNSLMYWFQKGADEIGLFPIPSEDVTNGLIIYYEPRGFNFSQDDYSTGTVTVTQGSTTVTGSGTTFTSSMVGREFKVTDGSDGFDYRVASYTSGTVITLEEPFIGISGSGKTYLIGEAPTYPSEYHDAPVDYAVGRYFQMNGNMNRARMHMSGNFRNPGLFETAILNAKERYSSSSSSQVILDDVTAYNPWFDNTRPVTEP